MVLPELEGAFAREGAYPERTVKSETSRITVVAKDTQFQRRIEAMWPDEAIEIRRESSIDHAVERFESEPCDVLLVTSAAFKAGEIEGIEFLDVILAKSPTTKILFLVKPKDIRIAMSALKAGSYQYAKWPNKMKNCAC